MHDPFFMLNPEDFQVKTLGECTIDSPLGLPEALFVSDDVRVRYAAEIPCETGEDEEASFEKAGPRKNIFFDPAHAKPPLSPAGGSRRA